MIEFIAGCMAGIAIAKKVRAIAEWKPEIQNPFKDKIEIVKFDDNKYAIRKKRLLYESSYFSVRGEAISWWPTSYLVEYGLGTLEECKARLSLARAEITHGTPISD